MLFLTFALLTGFNTLFANLTGADPKLTAAPGDDNCTSCHLGTALNAGGGSVKILLPGDNTYTPGVKQHITVQITDATQRRWGFEITARVASNPSTSQAGTFTSTDGNTQVICDTGRSAPCSSDSVIQFVTHTQTGTRLGTTGSINFEFDWTTPSTDVGNVILYVAGNAANGDTRNVGDHIYTANLELTPAVSTPKPAISTELGVKNAANALGGIAPLTWLTITGSNFTALTRTWTTDEATAVTLPSKLEDVLVTINDKSAFIQSISPTQINVLTPADDALGSVAVRVISNNLTSDAIIVNLQQFAPALFTFDGKYAATSTGNNPLLDQSAQFFNAPDSVTAFKPGDTLTLYATGLGNTDPAQPAGKTLETALDITTPISATIGDISATVASVQLVPGMPQIYKVTVTVPDALGEGDQKIVLQINGVNSPDNTFVKIQLATQPTDGQ